MIHTLRISCLSGPWLDEECVRFIDIPENANLYDLHVAIQDSVQFDDEFPFYFFQALAPEGKRTMIPEEFDPETDDIDTDLYEDTDVLAYAAQNAKKLLFYVFLSEGDDWIFKIQHTGRIHEAVAGEFYPLVVDSQSIGPNPEQYGSGFDDYAEDEDAFKPPRSGSGADYNRDDLDDDDFFSNDDDSRGYGRGSDEDDDDSDDDDW